MSTISSSGVATPTPMGLDLPPVGFRFHPTDPELLTDFLWPKIQRPETIDPDIAEVDVCKFEPRDLPVRSKIKSKDKVWYFFCRRQYKFKKSGRSNRTTKEGYWKADGKPRPIRAKGSKEVIGSKRTLVFHLGRPKGVRTKWIMHEYQCTPYSGSSNQGDFVLYKLKNKSDDTIFDECHQTSLNSITESHEMVSYSSHDIFGPSHGMCFGSNNENQGLCVYGALGELVDDVHANSIENNHTIGSNSTSPSISNYPQNLSEQSPHIPIITPQASYTQVTASLQASDTSLIAIGTSQSHYQISDNAEVISIAPEKQTNTTAETHSKIPPEIFHISEILDVSQVLWCDGSDKCSSISPSGNAHYTHEFSKTGSPTVSDFAYRNLDDQDNISVSVEVESSPYLATPSTDFVFQNQYDSPDIEMLDGLMASDLESQDEKPEELPADVVAWRDSMLEEVSVICSEEIPSPGPLSPESDSTIWSSPLWDSTI